MITGDEFDHPVLGRLVYKRDDTSYFTGHSAWDSHTVEISILASLDCPDETALANMVALVQQPSLVSVWKEKALSGARQYMKELQDLALEDGDDPQLYAIDDDFLIEQTNPIWIEALSKGKVASGFAAYGIDHDMHAIIVQGTPPDRPTTVSFF